MHAEYFIGIAFAKATSLTVTISVQLIYNFTPGKLTRTFLGLLCVDNYGMEVKEAFVSVL